MRNFKKLFLFHTAVLRLGCVKDLLSCGMQLQQRFKNLKISPARVHQYCLCKLRTYSS